jgi:DNA-3-methyladenine glycosylase II
VLASRDPDLAAVVERCGPPQFWSRPRGFATLVYIVLEQQVSLASARATYDKLTALLPEFTETNFLGLSDQTLRSAGVSRQKQRYTRLIAEAILDGTLPLRQLGRRSDAEARALLTQITGIGNWTADVYLMVALRRPDLWPTGDLALVKAIAALKPCPAKPDPGWLEDFGEQYRPYRSVATRIYWQHYLHG